jgi:hypothetical protein
VRAVNLGVRFLLELAALAALGVWGWHAPGPVAVQVLAAAVTPLATAMVWGTWVAPKARRRLPDPLRLGVEVLVFGNAVVGLLVTGLPGLALALGVAYAVNVGLMFAWHQRDH